MTKKWGWTTSFPSNLIEINHTSDNQPPILYLANRLWSKDLKHLIPIPVNPDYRVSINQLVTHFQRQQKQYFKLILNVTYN